MKHLIKILITSAILLTACSKDSTEICGEITGGEYNAYTDMFYLRIDGRKHWVDMKTYESYYVGDFICLEDY